MGNIRIKDKESLVKILKTISWLDTCRWDPENNVNFINFSNDLTNCQKILTHWICYITDRQQIPFENVWENGGYIFSKLE